jgi:hypothetical protein
MVGTGIRSNPKAGCGPAFGCLLYIFIYLFIMGPCHFERVTSHYYHIHIYEHITNTTVNIRIGMSDPSVA